MRPSINNYSYYVDFEKVYANVESIRIELNIMNSLMGSKNIEADFAALLSRYPEILKYPGMSRAAVRTAVHLTLDMNRDFCFSGSLSAKKTSS